MKEREDICQDDIDEKEKARQRSLDDSHANETIQPSKPGEPVAIISNEQRVQQAIDQPSSASESDLCAAALDYAGRGWPVLPLHTVLSGACSCSKGKDCKSIGKHPRTQKGLKEASADKDLVQRWWAKWPNANVGILTGPESNLAVLDVDPRHGSMESKIALWLRRSRSILSRL